MIGTKHSAPETAADRQLRREALLRYGQVLATGLRFRFDFPDSDSAIESGEGDDEQVELIPAKR